jgi:hypothetical protein
MQKPSLVRFPSADIPIPIVSAVALLRAYSYGLRQYQ